MFKEYPLLLHHDQLICMEDYMFNFDNKIWIQGKITPDLVDSLLMQLSFLENKFNHDISNYDNNVITVCIDSCGGNLCQAMNFAKALIDCPFQVKTIVTGNACSSAALIALAGDERECFEYSKYLLHEPYCTKNNISDCSVEEVEKISNNLKEHREMTISFIAERTNMSKATVRKLITNRNAYFTADEAIKNGIATAKISRFI